MFILYCEERPEVHYVLCNIYVHVDFIMNRYNTDVISTHQARTLSSIKKHVNAKENFGVLHMPLLNINTDHVCYSTSICT